MTQHYVCLKGGDVPKKHHHNKHAHVVELVFKARNCSIYKQKNKLLSLGRFLTLRPLNGHHLNVTSEQTHTVAFRAVVIYSNTGNFTDAAEL